MDSVPSAIKDKPTFKFRQFIEQYGVYLTLVILLIISALITPNMFEKETLAVMFTKPRASGTNPLGTPRVNACWTPVTRKSITSVATSGGTLRLENKSWGFLSIPLLLWLILNGLFLIILRRTSYGRRIYAVGSNPEAARLNGIPVNFIKISVYVLGSGLAVISGVILTGYVGYVDRFIATGLDLDSIAAAVVGGTSFFGGKGQLMGTIAGVMIIQILSTMVVLIGLDIETQFIIKGLVILAAVSLYSLAHKDR